MEARSTEGEAGGRMRAIWLAVHLSNSKSHKNSRLRLQRSIWGWLESQNWNYSDEGRGDIKETTKNLLWVKV